ncbi:exotoxin beta-grasp domain-containing protein [Staphylococcus agnetis]|uniref:exotoxin beta-grasp domain-containing protein n=1 Tax=Staphylococcus agnetis TaxID=985762 RepID=UPI001ADB91E2|nr:exotoxin beta-grasp domain-containing protein [Staphylococcus agnetis]
MKYFKVHILLIIFLAIFLITVLFSPFTNAVSNDVPEKLHKKSELDTTQLHNLSSFYKDKSWLINVEDKVNKDQLLSNDLIYTEVPNPSLMTDALKVEFEDGKISNQFKGQKVDIFGISYANNCVGLVGNKTACMYGGVTQHDNNQLNEERQIGINIFRDGSQQIMKNIKTRKKQVTLQELDIKTRNILEEQSKIYNQSTSDIQKGYVHFHSHNQMEPNYFYDLYDFNGKSGSDFFRFYNDNIIVRSSNYHIDVYLFTR